MRVITGTDEIKPRRLVLTKAELLHGRTNRAISIQNPKQATTIPKKIRTLTWR